MSCNDRSEFNFAERCHQRLGVFESGVTEGGQQLGRLKGYGSVGTLGGRAEGQEELHSVHGG